MKSFNEFLNENNLLRNFTFDCLDCKKNVQEMKEYSYMVSNQVWEKTNLNSKAGFLCIGCLEKRLKRLLTSHDFPKNIPINGYTKRQSKRLLSRINGYTDNIPPDNSKYYAMTGSFQ